MVGWVGAAMSLAGTAMGAMGAAGAAGSARDAAYNNARLYNQQMLEEMRRKRRQHDQLRGQMKATAYASGLRADRGTTKTWMDEQSAEMDREMAWMNRHRVLARRAARKGAQVQFNAAQWQIGASMLQGATRAYGQFQQTQAPTTSMAPTTRINFGSATPSAASWGGQSWGGTTMANSSQFKISGA